MEVSQTTKNKTTLWSCYTTPGHISAGMSVKISWDDEGKRGNSYIIYSDMIKGIPKLNSRQNERKYEWGWNNKRDKMQE
jgi:hypothetical protein